MRILARVLTEKTNAGTSAKTGKPYSITTVRLLELAEHEEQKVAENPLTVTLSKSDNDLIGQLEGKEMLFDLYGAEIDYRKTGVEYRGSVVREPRAVAAPAASSHSTAA